jgi:glucosamine-6-phosphate deaminase
VNSDKIFSHCREYEQAIDRVGGIDLQILGIGRTGHIGFNEPGSSKDSLTRRITLDRITRQDAASDFRGEENVPRFAITMGVGTILRAKRIVLMAWGGNKASVVAKSIEGPITDAISASFLQEHPDAQFYLDCGASRELTRIKLPWLVGPVKWTAGETLRAVCWLSETLKRPVLKLVDEDYNEHGLSDLLNEQGPAYQLNIRVFNRLQQTISGWPGGKPCVNDTLRPERANPYPKRCLIFSPEPQDAMVAIGGTIDRLREQGHEVCVISLTSGSLRIGDSEADKFASTLDELAGTLQKGNTWQTQKTYAREILKLIEKKGEFGEDPPALRKLKGLVLRGETREAAAALSLVADRTVFLDLPFYERGRYRRFLSSDEDVKALLDIIRTYKPLQIYLTGNATDPSSVAAIGFKVAQAALIQCEGEHWLGSCSFWLYQSGDKGFEPYEIDMAVPMSPVQMERKTRAMNRYQSLSLLERQTPDQNRDMAGKYDSLGLAQYEAMECFRRWDRCRGNN